MDKEKFKKTSAVLLILASIILSGCSKSPEPNVARVENTNQTRAALNSNISANDNISESLPNTQTTTGNDTAASMTAKDKKSAVPAKQPTPQIGGGGGDLFLVMQARSALSSDQELLNSVVVEIKEGGAVLTGNVSSEAQKIKAGQLVQGVKGFKGVKNNLIVAH